jgi:hypothetical protein
VFVSLDGCGGVSDWGTGCGETAVDELEGSPVWWDDCAGSVVRPSWTGDEASLAVVTEACFSLRAGMVTVGWASPGSSTSWARLEGMTHGMRTRTSLLRNDCLVWDFGDFSCLTGEVAVASEADRAPSEEDLLPLRPEWVRVPAEVEREPLSFSSATCLSPAGMSVEVVGLGVALVVVAVVVVVVGC